MSEVSRKGPRDEFGLIEASLSKSFSMQGDGNNEARTQLLKSRLVTEGFDADAGKVNGKFGLSKKLEVMDDFEGILVRA